MIRPITAQELQKNLGAMHPYFGQFQTKITPLSVKDLFANADLFRQCVTGHRLIPMDVYSATFRLDAGKVEYKIVEGFFHSFAEAVLGFRALPNMGKLIGVRPGMRVLPDELRDALRARNESRQDLGRLRSTLLSQINYGVVLLDQIANQEESKVAEMAGQAIAVSWWAFFTKRTRYQLINVLKSQQDQQALRMEILDALGELSMLEIESRVTAPDGQARPRHALPVG